MVGSDPREVVEGPVRRELGWLVARGVGLFGAVALLAACPIVGDLGVADRDHLAMAAPVLLLGYVGLVYVRRLALGPTSERAREAAWSRATEVDRDDAMLGRLVVAWVPVGLLLALGVLLWPHLTDPNPALACAWAVLGLPPIVFAWLLASSTWLDAAREDLARAEDRSDALFRAYWANPGR